MRPADSLRTGPTGPPGGATGGAAERLAPPIAPWLHAEPDAWLRHVLAIHFDPDTGAPYWLERQRALGIDVRREIRTRADLVHLGPMPEDDLARVPLPDWLPRGVRERPEDWVVVESGGTTGVPKTTLYREPELRQVFVDPFTAVARSQGFPQGALWLFAGPTGPHVIGRAARENARALGSPEPFCLDFDPRWAKRLEPGSMGQRRYLDHVVGQALRILRVQEIGVLFSTPVMLLALAEELEPEYRERIGGVFYGGLPIDPDDAHRLREAFPRAVHLAGFGNTLLGLALELRPSADGRRAYFYPGARLHLRLVKDGKGQEKGQETDAAEGERGRVVASRLDESFLLVNLYERDEATRLPVPGEGSSDGAPWPVTNPGLGDPGPLTKDAPAGSAGLY